MHKLSINDVWILVGIYCAELRGGGYYADIISALPDIGLPFPTHNEFASAYNKFLYIRFIEAYGERTTLSAAAKQLIASGKNLASTAGNDREWIDSIYQLLSAYKLKSMCNRHVWTENQYTEITTPKKD